MAIETTDFEDILREAATEVTALDPDNLDIAEFRAIRRSAKRRLEIAWEYHYWPTINFIEQRFYRPDWDAVSTFTVGNILYYPPTQKYYQALQTSTNQPPADDLGNPNLLFWDVACNSYAASFWTSTTLYAQGSRAQYGDQVYELFVPGPVIGVLPTDSTQWALLTPFDQYIAYEQDNETPIGKVNAAWNANPRTTTRYTELNWFLSENGVQILSRVNFAWLDYRIRCPKLSGDNFDPTLAYPVGAQIYYSSATTPGNFFTQTGPVASTPGQSPDNTLIWNIIQIPRVFHKYLVHGVAADWIRGPGGGSADDATLQIEIADGALEDQKSLLVGQQSQRVKTVVRTR